MIRLEKALVELLIKHNCVIVPDFGGFVARTSGAKINREKGVIEPPKKSLLFNRSLINNDGLLVDHLAQQQMLTYDQSLMEVKSLVKTWQQDLKLGKRIEIDRIGILYLDEEQNIHFEQDRHSNLLLASYGLETLHFVGTEELQIISKKQEKDDQAAIAFATENIEIQKESSEASVIALPAQKNSLRFVKYAAAAAMIPFAFYTYWIPMKTPVLDSGIISINDFNPSYTFQKGSYMPEALSSPESQVKSIQKLDDKISKLPENVAVYSYHFSDDLYVPVRVKQPSVASEDVSEPLLSNSTEPVLGEFIVGAFSKLENANQLVHDLKKAGLQAKNLGLAKNMYRVSAGSPTNAAELEALKLKTSTLDLEGWLLK